MEKICTIIGATVAILVVFSVSSLLPTLLWYCFDDQLASMTHTPELGEIAWYRVWAATLFLSCIFKASHTTKKDK